MRRMAKWAGLVLVLLTGTVAAATDGEAAPGFQLPGRQGQVDANDYRGKVLWLDFWASWCGPCRESFPWMNSMLKKYRSQGLAILAINLDQDQQEAKRFLKQYQADFDIAFDTQGQTPEHYGVQGMPSAFLISAEGRIIGRHTGFRRDSPTAYENQLRAALGLPQMPSGESE